AGGLRGVSLALRSAAEPFAPAARVFVTPHLLGADVSPGPRCFGGRLAQAGVLGGAELSPPLLLGLGDFGGSTGYWIHNSTLIGSARWGDVAGGRFPRTGISRRTRRA